MRPVSKSIHFFDLMNYGKEHKVEFVFYNRYQNEIKISHYYNFANNRFGYIYIGVL